MKPLLSKIIRKPIKDLVKIKGNTGLLTNNADGLNALVNGRSSTATVVDHEGIVRTCLVGEVRYSGGRRAENGIRNRTWATNTGTTVTVGNVPSRIAGQLADTITYNGTGTPGDYRAIIAATFNGSVVSVLNNTYVSRVTIRANVPTTIKIRVLSGGESVTVNVTTSWQIVSLATVGNGSTQLQIQVHSPTATNDAFAIQIGELQKENTTYQTNKNPSEYIDYNTIYNAGVAGVYYSNRYNGNTVASNIVTEAQGALLPTVPVILSEPLSTNLLSNWDGNLAAYSPASGVSDAISPINGFLNSIQFSVSATTDFCYKTYANTNGITYTLSVFVQMDDLSAPVISGASRNLQLTVNSTQGDADGMEQLGSSSVYRLYRTFVGNGINPYIGVVKYSSFTQKAFKVVGYQLEQKPYVTSPIPTTTVAVSRAADSISLPLVLDSNFKQSKGIVLHKIKMLAASSAVNNSILSFNTGVTDFIYSNDGYLYLSDGTNTASVNISGYAVNDTLLICVAYNYANGLMSLHVSKNGGVWIDSINTTYDKAFPVGSNILFASGNTDSMQILYSNIKYTKKSIFQMQNWIKTKATLEAS